ncbi:MAG: hypothetical protein PHV34_06540 [Verrucomicrobiae bacterium]|nr:hypothetical protein [Verrucomicrobiae bacterium]
MKMLVQMVFGAIGAILTALLLVFGLAGLSEIGVDLYFCGCKGAVLDPMLFGAPIGGVCGLVLYRRIFGAGMPRGILPVILGIVLGTVGAVCGIMMMDIAGVVIGLVLSFVTSVFFCFTGCHAPLIFMKSEDIERK